MKRYIPYVVCILMVLAALGALSIKRTFRGNPEGEITFRLPDSVGAFRGVDVLFCQNQTCARMFDSDALGTSNACLNCESPLDPISVGERQGLPQGTPIIRRSYQSSSTTPSAPSPPHQNSKKPVTSSPPSAHQPCQWGLRGCELR